MVRVRELAIAIRLEQYQVREQLAEINNQVDISLANFVDYVGAMGSVDEALRSISDSAANVSNELENLKNVDLDIQMDEDVLTKLSEFKLEIDPTLSPGSLTNISSELNNWANTRAFQIKLRPDMYSFTRVFKENLDAVDAIANVRVDMEELRQQIESYEFDLNIGDVRVGVNYTAFRESMEDTISHWNEQRGTGLRKGVGVHPYVAYDSMKNAIEDAIGHSAPYDIPVQVGGGTTGGGGAEGPAAPASRGAEPVDFGPVVSSLSEVKAVLDGIFGKIDEVITSIPRGEP